MIWLAFLVVSVVVMLPVLAIRGKAVPRGRHEAAIAFYRAQLDEIAHEAARGALDATAAREARLEIARRLLAAGGVLAEVPPALPRPGRRWPLAVVLPVLAIILYLQNGAPLLPGAPIAPRIAALDAKRQQDQTMLSLLRAKVASLPPRSDEARRGYVLLGRLEADMGDTRAAANAWGQALAIHPDPQLQALRDALPHR